MPFKEGYRTNSRGQELYHAAWLPDASVPVRAVLLWDHGLGDHSRRYDALFEAMAAVGIAVHAQDSHGHGRSEPRKEQDRCLVWRFDDLIDDEMEFMAEVRAGYSDSIPFFAGGQSMGGLIATHIVLRDQAAWAGLLLASAAIDVEWKPILRLQASVGNLLAAVIPRARIVPAVKPEYMSQDPAVLAAEKEDPYGFVGNARARTANELLKGFRAVQRRCHLLALPIFAHHGTHDQVTSLPAVRRLLAAAQSRDCTLLEVEGGYHELLLGPERTTVVPAMIQWIQAHTPAH